MDIKTKNSPGRDFFPPTRWSLIVNAGNSQSPRAESSLNELCGRYWFPLYVYARHVGAAHADAQDLVQSFYCDFLKKNYLRNLDSRKGRFRAFLLKCFQNHARNEWKRACRQKRGGGAEHLPIDSATTVARYQSQLLVYGTPECMFDRAWGFTLLEQVLEELGQEMRTDGKGELFSVLRPGLTVHGDAVDYASAAAHFNKTEEAIRKAAERMRKRYGELLHREILKYCNPAEVEHEIVSLLNAFSD